MTLRAYLRDARNAAVIMGLGDTIAQLCIENKRLNDWDAGRTMRFSALGFVFVGPVIRTWYVFLENKVPRELTVMQRSIRKMLFDQILFAPPFTLVMSCLVPLVNGESMEKIKRRIRESYFTLLGTSYMLWPAAQLINFSYVPLSYQVVYVQLVALIWNSYVSMMLNKKPLQETQEQ